MHTLWMALKLFLLLTMLTGVVYPWLITLIAQIAFPQQANGSFIQLDHQIVGSQLIGQKFEQPQYFWSRPSAVDYHTMPSGGSNLGPTSRKLREQVSQRRNFLAEAHAVTNQQKVPSDLLFASGSGLDPDITLKSAYFQVARVAAARGLAADEGHNLLNALIQQEAIKRTFGLPRVNVLQLNMALDQLMQEKAQPK